MQDRDPVSDRTAFVQRLLRSGTRAVIEQPVLTLVLSVLLAAVCLVAAVRNMGFKASRADLIDPEAPYHQRWVRYTEAFGSASDLIVVVEGEDPNTIKLVIDEIGTRMNRDTEHFRDVLYRVEPGNLQAKGLQYLSPQQLEQGLARLKELRPVTQGGWNLIGLPNLVDRLRYQLAQLPDQLPDEGRESADGRPVLLEHAVLLGQSLDGFLSDRSRFESPWPDVLTVDPELRDEANELVYFMNDAGTLGFLKAFPVRGENSFEGASKSIRRLRSLLSDVERAHPDVSVGLTGIPVLEFDEMHKSQSDMIAASMISALGVGLLLLVGFRGIRHPLLALLMLTIGMTWSFGFTTLAVGHLNILSVSFAAILIGLGIDFAIHYLARYLELRHEGVAFEASLTETSSGVGRGIVTAAVTTSLAFLCATFTSFVGVAELGVIAGGGIILCALATFVVLPALVSLSDRRVEPKELPTPFSGHWLNHIIHERPFAVAALSIVAVALVGSRAVRFVEGRLQVDVEYDYNLLNLQADGLESVEIQRRVVEETEGSLLFAVSMADDAQEARELGRRFEALPSVHHVEELGSRMPKYPIDQTGLLVQAYASELAHLPATAPGLETPDPLELGEKLESLVEILEGTGHPDGRRAAGSIDSFLDRFSEMPLEKQLGFLDAYQSRLVGSLLSQLKQLRSSANWRAVTLTGDAPEVLPDLPPALTSRFLSESGKWLIQIYPDEPIWDLAPLERFVEDVRSVDPDVTGTPLQNYEASRDIMRSYQNAALYALAVIWLALLFDFLGQRQGLAAAIVPLVFVLPAAVAVWTGYLQVQSTALVAVYLLLAGLVAGMVDGSALRDALLSLLPPLAGGLLMLGILAVFEARLNPANLIVLPLVLGIGVDDGVHVLHDYHMQKGSDYKTSPSTINAIVLTSLTSMIGFGSMMIAAHRGLSSVGLVLVIGVGSCLFVSLVTLPALLRLISQLQPRKGPGAAADDNVLPENREGQDQTGHRDAQAGNSLANAGRKAEPVGKRRNAG